MASQPEGCLGIVGAGVAVLVVIALTKEFGAWPWVIGGASVYLWFQFVDEKIAQENARKILEAERAPCKHGTVGARRMPNSCVQCVEEARAAERQRAEHALREAEEQRQVELAWRATLRNREYLRQVDPREFERIVLLVYQSIGYATEATPITGDQGIDGFLRLDCELVLLQCKRVQKSVGQPVIRDLYGNIKHFRDLTPPEISIRGLLVTTGRASQQARSWAVGKPIQIVEIDALIALIDRHIRLDEVIPSNFSVISAPQKGICSRCGGQLKRVMGRNGAFYGCINYPRCRFSQKLLNQ